jgi:pyrroline-5-carboxylate reductase
MSRQAIPPIGFLGAGKMATALASGWISAGLVRAEQIRASDPAAEARDHFQRETGVAVGTSNKDVVAASEAVVLAVKPQQVAEVLSEVAPLFGSRHLLISIAAGIPLARLADLLGSQARLVRVMPNTPALVGAGAAAHAASAAATPHDIELVDRLLNAVGRAFPLPEKLLDAVTGLSGSGPAFVYVLIEALSDGGVLMGLPRAAATELAAQTVLGAARMVLETNQHPGALKDMVTSPAGTTITGLHALEKGGFRAVIMDAVQAATRRAEELSKK